ncbi:MAG: hypothetical protein JO127_13310 [Caulobacteraceae bacterium]|nr:hypothetical protein [Caulobacteraceae bacterium]
MKLASLRGGRDGALTVVSEDLAWRLGAEAAAPTMQAAFDDWDRCEPLRWRLSEGLEAAAVDRRPFVERDFAAPSPRPYQWADGSAYVNHVRLLRRGPDGGPRRPIEAGWAGYSCIAGLRTVETTAWGAPATDFLRAGERVRIAMCGADGRSIFGAIDQQVEPVHG